MVEYLLYKCSFVNKDARDINVFIIKIIYDNICPL